MKKSQELQFNIMFRPEPEGGFTAIVPSLPGCVSYGKDLKEAKEAITDAIRGYIASVKKHKGQVANDAESFMSSVRLSGAATRQHA